MTEFERGAYLVASKVQAVVDGLDLSPSAVAAIEAVLDEHTPTPTPSTPERTLIHV